MNTGQMLRVIRRHTLEAIIHVLRVAVNYRKVQKQLKKLLYIWRLPWPDQLFTTERTMRSFQLPLQAFQWASRIIFHFYCLHYKIKSLLEESTSLEKYIFGQFSVINPSEKIARSRNLHQNPLHTFLLCSSIEVICIILRHAERTKL